MAQNKSVSIGPGKAVYPRLSTPDTKFDELGMYKADVSVPMKDAEPVMRNLTAAFKAHTGKPPKRTDNTMWYFETNEDGEETGNVVFKCRVKNKLRKRDGALWDRKPKLFDAALKPVNVNPFGGSTIVVSAEIYSWEAGAKKGVSLQPVGVQIIELVEGSGPSASAMGFKAQEGFTGQSGSDEDDEVEHDEYDSCEDDRVDDDGADGADDDGDY